MKYLCKLVVIISIFEGTNGFMAQPLSPHNRIGRLEHGIGATSTALGAWWFGGTMLEQTTTQQAGDESCELVPVRIERPSSNSRRILGEIVVPVPLDDVWAILTDYNRLSVHVPNLVESKIVERTSGGEQGDGSFRCRLFQRGAQKIVGFEFGASVTMDMTEIAYANLALPMGGNVGLPSANGFGLSQKDERRIKFKCVESFFFNAFDGEWKVVEEMGEDGYPQVVLSYVVDVRPKGPVPVAALEWRIREDVPTNLRAVKKAAMDVGQEGVLKSRNRMRLGSAPARFAGQDGIRRRMERVRVQWDESETMAAYLDQKP